MAVSQHIRAGEVGEQVAVDYLVSNGFEVLERNFMAGQGAHCVGEIDIIALRGGELHFVEVKCRCNDIFGGDFAPESALTRRKEECMLRAAEVFLRGAAVEFRGRVSFDLVAVNLGRGGAGVPVVRYYESVFG